MFPENDESSSRREHRELRRSWLTAESSSSSQGKSWTQPESTKELVDRIPRVGRDYSYSRQSTDRVPRFDHNTPENEIRPARSRSLYQPRPSTSSYRRRSSSIGAQPFNVKSSSSSRGSSFLPVRNDTTMKRSKSVELSRNVEQSAQKNKPRIRIPRSRPLKRTTEKASSSENSRRLESDSRSLVVAPPKKTLKRVHWDYNRGSGLSDGMFSARADPYSNKAKLARYLGMAKVDRGVPIGILRPPAMQNRRKKSVSFSGRNEYQESPFSNLSEVATIFRDRLRGVRCNGASYLLNPQSKIAEDALNERLDQLTLGGVIKFHGLIAAYVQEVHDSILAGGPVEPPHIVELIDIRKVIKRGEETEREMERKKRNGNASSSRRNC